jgi:formylglycine-generating enzyme required for sulfatase activity
MKTKLPLLFITLALLTGVRHAAAQPARFFRISGPAATTITAFRLDGTLTWTNAQPGAMYSIQTVSALPGNWVNYVQVPTTNEISTNLLIDFNAPAGMELIPAGSFTMGDTLDGESDAPPTLTYVSAFYMDTNLVSYSQWQGVFNWATNHGYTFDNAGSGKAPNHPVQTLDWYDTVKCCNARSQKAGLTPVYYTNAALTQVYTNGDVDAIYANWLANGYRLPTEAEWEKAARGGLIGQRFPWGNIITGTLANYEANTDKPYDLGPDGYNPAFATGGFPYTSPVGYFAPNGYGLYDMAGNVREQCWDWYATSYVGGSDPHGPASGDHRVVRGGDWNDDPFYSRSADRLGQAQWIAYSNTGFRCVRGF